MLFLRKNQDAPWCSAVVPAAGSSTRMEGRDKLLAPLGGVPVLARSLLALEGCPLVHEIVVVTRSERIPEVARLCVDYGVTKAARVVEGGQTRARSVLNGVLACHAGGELIAIHDAARPFPSQRLLEEILRTGARTGACAPAVAVKDTIKRARQGVVVETPDRSTLFAVQTPQVFEADLIRGALLRALEEGAELTDDCSAVERLGMKVTLCRGSEENLKITTPLDLLLGEAILEGRGEV